MMNMEILLVEDNPSDVELTKRALKKNHIFNELIVVEDGQEALDFLFEAAAAGQERHKGLAVILLDLNLPKVSGLEVLQKIRADERTKFIPVVVLTTSKREEDILASYKLGANSFIRKPVDFTQFIEAVRNLGLYWLLLNEPPPR